MRGSVLIVLVILATALGAVGPARAANVGDVVPDFCLTDLEGNEVCLSDLASGSEFVVVELLNVYCHTCREAVPVTNDVQAWCTDQGIPFIAIAISGNSQEVMTFKKRFGARYEVLPDPDRNAIPVFTPDNVPTLDVIDPSRTLLYRHVGKLESADQFVRIVERLRAKLPIVGVHGGQEAPPFTLRSLDGEKISLAALRGQRVVLGFFSDLSDKVIDQATVLYKVQRLYEGEKVVVLAVFSGLASEALSEFSEEHQVQYEILIDSGGDETAPYREAGLPHVWVINEAGRVRQEDEFIDLDNFEDILGPLCELPEEEERYWLQQAMPLATSFNPLFLGGENSWEYEALREDTVIGLVRRTCRKVWCPPCKDVHFIYAVDMEGRVVKIFMIWPVEHCGGEQPPHVVERFKQQIIGHSITDPLVMGESIYGISESTNSTEEILEGINETLKIFCGYKDTNFMAAFRKQKCFAKMGAIHEALLKYNDGHRDNPMISLDLEKLREYFPEGKIPRCPLDGTYVLTDWDGKQVILCTFHGVDLEYHDISLE